MNKTQYIDINELFDGILNNNVDVLMRLKYTGDNEYTKKE